MFVVAKIGRAGIAKEYEKRSRLHAEGAMIVIDAPCAARREKIIYYDE